MTNLIAELTPEELATLKSLIQETVYEILDEYSSELEFRPEVEARLLAFLRDRPAGRDAKEVHRELGLDV